MKQYVFASLLALTLGAAAGSASAQTPTLPPTAPQTGAAPAPPAAPAAPAGAARVGTVRMHVHTLKNKGTARLYIRRPDNTYTLVCASPCTADVQVNSELRVTLGNNDEDPHAFTVSGDMGAEVDLEVKPASVGPLIGGIVMMGGGGAFILSGLLFLALSDITDGDTNAYSRRTTESYETFGYVCIGLGAGVAVGGLVWLLTRSQEPRVTDSPMPTRPGSRPADIYGRNETLIGDMASLRPRDIKTFTPAPFTPLRFGFSF